MGRRILALALALMLLAAFAGNGIVEACAKERTQTIDEIAAGFLDALDSGEGSYTFKTDAENIDSLMYQLFTAYPMIHHYYDSGSFLEYKNHLEVTFNFTNTADPLEELWMVGSDEDLMAVMGLCLAQGQREIKFVTQNGYNPDEEAFERAVQQLHEQHGMAYMGYRTRSYTCVSQESHDVRSYTLNIQYHYDMDTQTLKQWRRMTEEAVVDLTSNLVAMDMPDYLKVLLIHDWIISNTRYNYEDLEAPGNHVAYGPLVNGSAVCMGYAEAGLLLFRAVGLDAHYVSGTATNSAGETENHAWNAVKIDGEWYLVDMTWDDPVSENGEDILRYDYFLLTDEQMAKDHVRSSTDVPVCTGTAWNAERALEAREQDAGGYTAYGDAPFRTAEASLEMFRQAVTSAAQFVEQLQCVPAEDSGAEESGNMAGNGAVRRSVLTAAVITAVILVLLPGKKNRR